MAGSVNDTAGSETDIDLLGGDARKQGGAASLPWPSTEAAV